MNHEDASQADALRTFADDSADGDTPAVGNDVEATVARTRRAIGPHYLAASAMPDSVKQSIWEDLMESSVMPRTSARQTTNDWTAPTRPTPPTAAVSPIMRAVQRMQPAVSLVIVVGFLVGLIGIAYQRGVLDDPGTPRSGEQAGQAIADPSDASMFHHASATPVEPAAKLYVGHAARFTAEIPGDWAVDPAGIFAYSDDDGFVADMQASGQTLDEACASMAELPILVGEVAVVDTTWAGQPACRIDGRTEDADLAALVVPHPFPFEGFEERIAYAALVADPDHIDAIIATLSFSPDRVTPEAYVTSVLDIVEARAWWSGEIDWEWARTVILASIEGIPTVEMAQGAILDIVEQLRTVGDNHSFVLLPDQQNALSESTGFGMMVGGTQVLMVYPDGPAYRAGVRAGDLIETLNGKPFLPTPYVLDPTYQYTPEPSLWGASAKLTLRRSGTAGPIAVTVEQGPYSTYVPPSGHRLADHIGYIQIPHYLTPGQQAEFAITANDIIAEVDQDPTCGWVVDLRLNGGGSYSPMVTGVGPILGNGTFVGWLSADGIQNWVTYQDGRITQDGYEISDYLAEQGMHELQRPNPPVAVLTGPMTASSGEVTTLAFVGRPDTRSFGETTAGATTANQSFPLFDGTRLVLAAAAMTDRTGATHMDGVAPDEWVSINWTDYGTNEDPVLNAAIDWLNQQPACADDTATPE